MKRVETIPRFDVVWIDLEQVSREMTKTRSCHIAEIHLVSEKNLKCLYVQENTAGDRCVT